MIDENMTYKFFSYHSFDWKEHSAKPVIVICDSCGTARKTIKEDADLLCQKCSNWKNTNEYKKINKVRKDKDSLINIKKCSICNKSKTLNYFYKSKRGKYGVSSRCKECEKEKTKKYFKDNPEYLKNYREDNIEYKEYHLKYNKDYAKT